MSNQTKLKEEILKLSESSLWAVAKTEWEFHSAEFQDEGFCLCDMRIKEHCHIINTLNGHITVVGNECVKQFGFAKFDTAKMFQAMRHIAEHPERHPGKYAAEAALRMGWITVGDAALLKDWYRVRYVPEYKQLQIALVNRRIVTRFMGKAMKPTHRFKMKNVTNDVTR